MKNRQTVLQLLDTLHIAYTLIEHPAVHTIADCLSLHGIDLATTEIPRNAFLCNRQQTSFYLMLLRHDIPFRTAIVSKALGVSRLSFAPQERLPSLLGLSAGAVSPLGLPFDKSHQVSLVLDEGLKAFEYLAFHPCDNTATAVLSTGDFIHIYLPAIGRNACWVDPE